MEAWPGRGEGGVRAWPGIIGVAVATPATPVAPALLSYNNHDIYSWGLSFSNLRWQNKLYLGLSASL